ncbi:MAG: tRNA (guanosine(46)-N7)-methyltransferase TrmB [Candidatus Latescibacterota bacterium]
MTKIKSVPGAPALLIDTSQWRSPAPSFPDMFGNDHPVEIEIGCGKAKMLIARAQNQPERNFIGIDYTWRFMRFGCQRSQKRGLANIRFIREEAKHIVNEFIRPESVSIFHIYFPDPWPKRRQQKRRLIDRHFVEVLHGRLAADGRIEIVTDDFDYSIAIKAAFAKTGSLWRAVKHSTNEPLFKTEEKTNYELKWRAAGRIIYYLETGK